MHRVGKLAAFCMAVLALGCGGGTSATIGGGGIGAGGGGMSGAGTGGATSSAGSGGRAPMRTVTDCAALGAVDQWEEITPPVLDPTVNNVLSVIPDPNTEGTVYAGTAKGGLWKSTDCGATWMKVNTGRSAGVLDSGSLWIVLADPGTANALYAGSLYGSDPSLLRSTNGGQDWDSVFPAGSNVATTVQYNFFQDAGIDPTNPRHVVSTFHADCTGATGPMCMAESTDSGATWRIFKGPTPGWGERSGVIVLDTKTFLYHTWEDGMFYTHDNGATWERVADGANFETYQATDGSFYLGSAFGLLHSQDGHAWAKVTGGVPADVLAGDGNRMFAAWGDTMPQFRMAMETDPTTWTTWPTPAKFKNRVGSLGYDSGHHILYSANTTDGLWRVVTVLR